MRLGRQGLRQRQNEFTSIAPWSTASHINRRQLENSCLTKYRGFRRSLYFLFIWCFKAADWTVDCASDRDNEHRINSSPERSTLLSRRICQPSLSSVSQSRSTTSWRWRASWEASSVFVSPCVRHKKPPGCPGQPCRTERKSPIAPDRQRHGRVARPWIVPGPVSFAAGFQIVPAEIRAHAMLRYQILFSNKLPAPITSARCTTSAPCTEIPAAVQSLPGN